MMRWADTRRPRRIVKLNPAMSGGVHDPESNIALCIAPDMFRVLGRRRPVRRRRATRTIPWAVALPLFVWMWWRGEL